MSILLYEDLEIAGFEGTVLVECELVLPVIRVKKDDLFFKLTTRLPDVSRIEGIDADSLIFSTRSEIEALANEGRVTLLTEPFPAFPKAVVAYVNNEFLRAANVEIPNFVKWQQLSDEVFVFCAPEDTAQQLLDEWATNTMDNATLLLERFFQTQDKQLSAQAEHFTDLALCAATDVTLRARIYLRAGLAVMFSEPPERLDNLYQLSVRRKFPDWSWETFQERLRRLADILRIRVAYWGASGSSSPSLLRDLLVFQQIDNLEERYLECQSMAQRYRERNLIPDEWIATVAYYIGTQQKIRLDNQTRTVLQGDTLFYYLAGVQFESNGYGDQAAEEFPLMRNETYLRAAQEFLERSWLPGEAAYTALTKFSRIAATA